jgi:hypothetical protein
MFGKLFILLIREEKKSRMTENDKILNLLTNYNELLLSNKYEKIIDLFYYDDLIQYKNIIQEFAIKMDFFGETEPFLKRLNVDSLEELKNIDEKELFFKIIKSIKHKISKKELKRIIDSIRITKVESIDYLATVTYEIEVKIYDEFELIEGKIDFIKSKDEFKILFKPLDLSKFQNQIDTFYNNKLRDKIHLINKETELNLFNIYGYKNDDGEVIIEPRFRDALPFGDNGLAPVKVMNKWTFINLKGEFMIKPQFDDVTVFSEGFAGVKKDEKWSLINSKCEIISEFIFDDIQAFSEELCAVCVGKKWGFINGNGAFVMEPKFKKVDNFYWGTADVVFKNNEGKIKKYTIDKNEKIVD